MVRIFVDGEALEMPRDFVMEIEDTSPVFNDRGSQSVAATVPATARNMRLTGWPGRIGSAVDPNSPERMADVVSGTFRRRGALNVPEASRDGLTLNVGFDNSVAYQRWQSKKLADLEGLPVWYPTDEGVPDVSEALARLYWIYRYPNSAHDFAVFPVAVARHGGEGSDLWDVLNVVGEHGLDLPNERERPVNGVLTVVRVPVGYGVSPLLKAWRLLELVFASIGLELTANPLHEDEELRRLVVLNNTADAVCRGFVDYADLMPDCTVEEFLNSLWVRFGLVYNVDFDAGTVDVRLIRDIVRSAPAVDLTPDACGHERMTYSAGQYVTLRAQTSLDGAAPLCERFEDFARGLDVSATRVGYDVSQWRNTGTADDPVWDGDVRDDWYDQPEPDYPEPDYDRDDWGDWSDSRSRARAADVSGGDSLAREFNTGRWYRLDSANGQVCEASSSFFVWDPQAEGLDALELSSADECVPVGRVHASGLDGVYLNDLCPLYLVGARHLHTYIVGAESETEDASTPLAYAFAYTKDQKTTGRVEPPIGGADGTGVTLDDGSRPVVSLLFQFRNGLFAHFWRDYDELLRHGARQIEVSARVEQWRLRALRALDPVSLFGVRCLIDTATYRLPSIYTVPVDLRLRTLQTQGRYDIRAEQGVPDFSTVRYSV